MKLSTCFFIDSWG